MKRAAVWLLAGTMLSACGGSSGGGSRDPAPGARATFITVSGVEVGEAVLFANATGVLIRTNLKTLTPGQHGFHVHAVGKCEPPFTSAGPHLNPLNRKHGLTNPEGPHAGDLTNLTVSAEGVARTEIVAAGLTLESLFDEDGSALVVHARADDYKTDPAGNSGDRIACGVVRRP